MRPGAADSGLPSNVPYGEAYLPGSVDQCPVPPLRPYYPPIVVQPATSLRGNPASIFVVSQNTMQPFGPCSQLIICPYCNKQGVTRVDTEPGLSSYFLALMLCLVGCWPVACLPFCMCNELHNVVHKCPRCAAIVGVHHGGFF